MCSHSPSRALQAPLVATYTVQRAGKPLPNLTATSKPPAEKKAKATGGADAAADGSGVGAAAASDSAAAAAAAGGSKKDAAAPRWEASTSDSDASASASGASGSDVSDSEGASTAIVSHEGARPASGGARRPAVDTVDERRPGYAAATAPNALADAFAVIRLGGRQYKVTPGDVINAEKVVGAEVGKVWPITSGDVLMIGTPTTTIVGRPAIPTASVTLEVEEHAQDEKVVVFHKKRRKRFQLTKGHRRDVTRLRVAAIQVDMAAYQ